METKADDVVVGAGLSGLTAAHRLIQAGVRSVGVLEANERAGGRTVDLPVTADVVAEGGGAWVEHAHVRLLALLDELGLETFKSYGTGKSIYMRNGKRKTFRGRVPPVGPMALLDYAHLKWRLDRMAKTLPPAAPFAAPNAREWDGITLGEWLDKHSRNGDCRWLLTLGLTVLLGEDPRNTSLLRFLHAIRAYGGLSEVADATMHRIVGGSQQVSLKIASQLGDRVLLGSPVSEIRQQDGEVVVTSARMTVRCERVIVAMAPPDAERIRFSPDLPSRRRILQRRWHSGSMIKAFAVYERPFWRDEGFSGIALTDLPTARFVVDNSPPDGQVGILLSFLGTAVSGADLTWSEDVLDNGAVRREAVVKDLTTLFGPQAAHPINYLDKSWIKEPWIAGCVNTWPPGMITEATNAFNAPIGRIHWAGTEAANEGFTGYLEGAVRAGERAAKEAREALSAGTGPWEENQRGSSASPGGLA